MATVYHMDQPGAPVPVYNSNQAEVGGFAAIKVFLKACLVDGYGAYAAAGWELIAEDTKYIVLRNGTHSGYVCLSFTGRYNAIITVSESFTGVVDDIMTGDGAKSGNSVSNTGEHRFSCVWAAYSSTQSCWFMVADEATFILGSSGSNSALSVQDNASATYLWKTLYVGEDSSGNFLALGGTDSSGDTLNSGYSYFNSNGLTTLKDPDTGLLVGSNAIDVHAGGLDGGMNSYQWKVKLDFQAEDVPLVVVPWGVVGSPPAGNLRGISLPGTYMAVSQHRVMIAMGVPDGMGIRNINTPVDLGDGYTYFVGPSHASVPTFLVTDNPEFW